MILLLKILKYAFTDSFGKHLTITYNFGNLAKCHLERTRITPVILAWQMVVKHRIDLTYSSQKWQVIEKSQVLLYLYTT